MIKRIFLFLALNFLIVLTVSTVLQFFNIRPYIHAYGLDYQSLMIFCLAWGMCGAFISLALSKVMAKWLMKVEIIDPHTANVEERNLYQTVEALSRKANLPTTPEVGIFPSKEVNAFATGPTKSRSLVAVSSGLLNRMSQKEIEGVLGHEIAHIANGDMVTMTLLQGVVNAFVMFLARVFAYALTSSGRNRQNSSQGISMGYIMLVYLFEVVFMILGSLLICAYSRFREYRADRGGAILAGKENMISSLKSLRVLKDIKDPKEVPSMAALKISHEGRRNLLSLFATHPPLEKRIERLEKLSINETAASF